MNITMVGTGYVGLVTGTLFADRGNKVFCVDNNVGLIQKLNKGEIHIFEPGLSSLVKKNMGWGNLIFTEDLDKAVNNSEIIFLAVGTPSNDDGSFNLNFLKSAAEALGKALQSSYGFKVIVVKSTVPQGTYKLISDIINEKTKHSGVKWAYVSNPETLAEGTAVKDFSKPDRIIIGTDSDKAFAMIKELYYPFIIKRDRIIRGSPTDAELAKLFSNTALAIRIAMVNEMARIADITPGADMDIIRRMMCEDNRIGYNFMFPSPGYGGSCFPKDIKGLVHQAEKDGYSPKLLGRIHDSNELHKNYIGEKVSALLHQQKPKVAIWGVTFKPNTDDMRDAASVPIITHLLNKGAEVVVYDPKDAKAREIFADKVTFVDEQYQAVKEADALILLTEWKQFDSPDFKFLKELMDGNQIFDLRNRWLSEAANRNGFDYYGVGRKYPLNL